MQNKEMATINNFSELVEINFFESVIKTSIIDERTMKKVFKI